MCKYFSRNTLRLALECPTKMFYSRNKEYEESYKYNDFLDSLAEGGFQVKELAKQYFKGGIEIEEKTFDDAILKTAELMQQDKVIIYNAIFIYDGMITISDIVIKSGNDVFLFEVSSKSIGDMSDIEDRAVKEGQDISRDCRYLHFVSKGKTNKRILKNWESYIYDIAFQQYIIQQNNPNSEIHANFMLVDKESKTTIEGLNQMFLFYKDLDTNKNKVKILNNNIDVGKRILTSVDVQPLMDEIFLGSGYSNLYLGEFSDTYGKDFGDYVSDLAYKYLANKKTPPKLGIHCKKCEFNSSEPINGYRQCWKEVLGWNDDMFNKPHLFDIWNFRNTEYFFSKGKYLIEDIDIGDIDVKPRKADEIGLSTSQRQFLQVSKLKDNDNSTYFDYDNMSQIMDSWTFPLHCIDFETSMVAIPFNKDRHPYEGIAFQFSHHTIDENGNVAHAGEFINRERGIFPNFKFVRELKNQLDKDEGTIFIYSPHENTFLNFIYKELVNSNEPDKEELCSFIMSITSPAKDLPPSKQWEEGPRKMVDMLELVKKFFYSPSMKGSNSIKQVLPAVLENSDFLRRKYCQPIYGAEEGIPSKNFINKVWLKIDGNGSVINPYKQLPNIHKGLDEEEISKFMVNGDIAEGGSAMIAYAKLQFVEMCDQERDLTIEGLLRYCELDTLAMVMIIEYWRELRDNMDKKLLIEKLIEILGKQ